MVKDSDDLPPKFTETIYRTKINEFSPKTVSDRKSIEILHSFSILHIFHINRLFYSMETNPNWRIDR